MFHAPKEYGYAKTHETYELAQASTLKSRDAFLPLMGWCSFLMSHFHDPISRSGLDIQRWEPLLAKAKFSQDYIQIIKASELVDFSPTYPRSGVFIKHGNEDFGGYVDLIYRKCNVPVWIYWGDVRFGAPKHDGVLSKYLPSNTEVADAKMAAQAAPSVATAKATAVQSLVDVQVVEGGTQKDPAEKFPEPEKRSGQKRGETWQVFFARMVRRRNEEMAREDAKARNTRLARERAQQNHPPPGLSSRAPSVYLWEEDIDTGFLLRKSIGRNHAQDIWRSYSNSQRRYDSTTNQWDICEEFDLKPMDIIHSAGGDPYEDMESDDDYGQLNRPLIASTIRKLSNNNHIPSISITTSTSQPLPPTSALPAAATNDDIDVVVSSTPPPPSSPIAPAIDSGLEIPSIHPVLQTTCEMPGIDNAPLAASTSQPLPHAPSVSAAKNDIVMSSIPSRPSSPIAPVIDGGLKTPSTPPHASQATCKLPDIGNIPLAITSTSQPLPPTSTLSTSAEATMSSIQSRPSSPIVPVIDDGLKTPLTAYKSPGIDDTPSATSSKSQPHHPNSALLASAANGDTPSCLPSPVAPAIPDCRLTIPSTLTTSTPPEGESIPSSAQKADEIDDTVSAHMPVTYTHSGEPGRYELIYGGPPAPLISLSFEHTLLEEVYIRYGFIGSNGGVSYKPTWTWQMVEKTFGHVQSGIDKDLRGSLSSFLELLLKPDVDPVLLQSLWDLAVD
jgi:hypothetical protein